VAHDRNDRRVGNELVSDGSATFTGALVIAGLFTLLPSRILGRVFFG
jgi:uncharacterized membrane protein